MTENIKQEREYLLGAIRRTQQALDWLDWLDQHEAWLATQPQLCVQALSGYVFLHQLHEDGNGPLDANSKREVLLHFGGKWTKTPNEATIQYTQQDSEPRLVFYTGVLPLTCRVVEEVVAVPASTHVVKKIVCNTPDDLEGVE